MIRPAERDDIPAVVDFHLRVFGMPPGDPPPPPDLDYETIFFDHPWYDSEIRSLMYEKDGEVLGFMGIVARQMEFADRPIRAAIPTKIMVDAERGGALIAVQLLKALAAMPHDVAVNDGSNDVMREVWQRAGAEILVPSSLHWVRPFRPAEHWRHRVSERDGLAGLAGRLALPATGAADMMLRYTRWNDFSAGNGLVTEPTLEAARLLPLIEREAAQRLLRPVYDEATLAWQLGQLERMGRYRELSGAIVRTKKGKDLGWYLYYHRPRGVSEVLQFVAYPGREEAVFARLLAEARERGATALGGRSDVRLLPVLANQRCDFELGHPWTLVVTRHDELRSALQGKDAFFTRMEGEWW
ncbi:MAG: GNAT family N-acetyltransferase [Gemmatimonadota bacterium]|nr:MAG: GNAT family N-acetyltransferase [Gemmatimonadota bacterium]